MKNSPPQFIPAFVKVLGTHNLLISVLLSCISFPVFTIGVYHAYQIHRDINNTALHEMNIKRSLREFSEGAAIALHSRNATLVAEPLALFVAGNSGALSQIDYIELSYSNGSALSSAWAANVDKKDLSNTTQISHPLFHKTKQIGQISAHYRPVPFSQALWPHLRFLAMLFLIQVAVGVCILSLYVHFRLIRPMRKLAQAAQNIADGDLSQPFPRSTQYEIDEISRHLEETRLKAIGAKRSLEQLDT